MRIYKCSSCGAYTFEEKHCGKPTVFLMTNTQRVKLSKFLSLLLRHNPQLLNLELDSEGFTKISLDELAKRISQQKNFEWVSKDHIIAVVSLDPKGRFEIKDNKIRATYGHTIDHKIEYHKLKVNELPSVLYHGTISSRLSSILKEGIKPMKRKYVHLSLTIEDALIVGLRRKKKGDKVVILEVDPASLIEKGYDIFKASETVFLVKKVPPDCIRNIREMQL
ncbi:MAG: RNA 2'-phosphotransferase [Candidatus Odinarchaeota archaeon]|nr:RNA 2'-phosphotransferase [Candidatus Odinarchaeota archaeon]